MDLTQIRYFLALARTLNFTRAAESCNVTQPALTKSIQRLEDELGGPLILRERALTQLTDLGRAMLPLLEQAYTAAERAKEHASDLKKQTAAPLRVGLGPDVPAPPFMPIFRELAAKLPGFELTLSSGEDAALCDDLLHGALDVAVVGTAALPDRMNRWTLFAEQMLAVLPEDDAALQASASGSVYLEHSAVIARAPGCATSRWLDHVASAHAARPAARHVAATDAQAIAMVRAGLGITLQPSLAEQPPGLAVRPVEGLMPFDVILVAVAGRPSSRAAATFMKAARARTWQENRAV